MTHSDSALKMHIPDGHVLTQMLLKHQFVNLHGIKRLHVEDEAQGLNDFTIEFTDKLHMTTMEIWWHWHKL